MTSFADIVGSDHVLTGAEMAPYLTDWTGAYTGSARAVLRPGSTEEVARIVALARSKGLPVTVQGGNTSVSGGSVPGVPDGIVLSLTRMARIRAVDPVARTATVDGGVVLQVLQERVAQDGLDFPLMFAARGTATIGGALATNAGGSNVLLYGNARDQCLGIEAVLADGSVMHGLSGLRKDNSGFDLRHLLCGSEGTLGIITGAVLQLVPRPRVRATAFLSLAGLEAALDVLNALQDATGGLVEAFEWLPGEMMRAILAHRPDLRAPLEPVAETHVLVELASTRAGDAEAGAEGATRLDQALLAVLEVQMAAGRVLDGAVAASEAQRQAFWAVREAVLETLVAQDFTHLDIALPLSRFADFIAAAAPLAEAAGLRPLLVGHLGDGNVHYAVVGQGGQAPDPDRLAAFLEALTELLLAHGGSFSAEHGIGRSKTRVMAAHKDPAQLAAMRAIKGALDPEGVFNRGVLFGG
ncbi:MAG: FAD-binding oxidoreductase [Pseudomonadota bacterium]